MEIVWSKTALKRLDQIFEFIADHSIQNAEGFIDKILKSANRLAQFPESGAYLLINPAFRQVVVSGYRIIYRIQEKQIQIITIVSPGLDQF